MCKESYLGRKNKNGAVYDNSKKNGSNNGNGSVKKTDRFEFDHYPIIISAKNEEQKDLIKSINDNKITFVQGYPGSGKTFLSVSMGLQKVLDEKFSRMVISRPIVEAAGEKLGFLPGSLEEKSQPYMVPIFDTILEHINIKKLNSLIGNNSFLSTIRILPLAYMRGLTFKDAYVVVDEAQNTTPEQMRMLLTRIGENCKVVICGDIYQSDIRATNGLENAFQILQGIEGIGFVTMSKQSIVRDKIVQQIEQCYREQHKNKMV